MTLTAIAGTAANAIRRAGALRTATSTVQTATQRRVNTVRVALAPATASAGRAITVLRTITALAPALAVMGTYRTIARTIVAVANAQARLDRRVTITRAALADAQASITRRVTATRTALAGTAGAIEAVLSSLAGKPGHYLNLIVGRLRRTGPGHYDDRPPGHT